MARSVSLLAIGLLLALAACDSDDGVANVERSTITVESSPAMPTAGRSSSVIDLYWPTERSASNGSGPPVVVLVPGGGWATADPTGLIPLAQSLADQGAVAATVTYRAAADGIHFPEQVEDVACAIANTVAQTRDAGHEHGEVVVVGHSAGAHLGALVVLSPAEFATGCPDPPVEVDRFVGLAGPYDVVRAQGVAADLFGPGFPDPADWSVGNPMVHAANQPEVAVLLVHGRSDRTVPLQFTESFAHALEEGGHSVTATYPESVDHHTVYSTDVATPIIAEWLDL